MIGSNPIFSTELHIGASQPLFDSNRAKTAPEIALQSKHLPYTLPVIFTGKEPKHIPRKSDKYSEIAKNKWYLEFLFYDDSVDKMVRFRLSKQLNRIKEYHEKLTAFTELQANYTEELKNGWNPFKKEIKKPIIPSLDNLLLSTAIENFLQYHKGKGSREKTIQSYHSKLKSHQTSAITIKLTKTK